VIASAVVNGETFPIDDDEGRPIWKDGIPHCPNPDCDLPMTSTGDTTTRRIDVRPVGPGDGKVGCPNCSTTVEVSY